MKKAFNHRPMLEAMEADRRRRKDLRDANITLEDGKSPLFTASLKGDLDVAKALIGAGANVNDGDKGCKSPLCVASDKGHLEVVKALIEAGANVNQATKNGCSPLYLASDEGHLEVVKTLLEAGAIVNQATEDGLCPLYTASGRRHLEVVKTLIEAEANVNQADKVGKSPLFSASSNGHLDVVKTLIEAGANVNQANKNGWNPLLIASSNGHLNVVKTLIEAGANISQANKNGWSPIHAASFYGHLDVVMTLTEAGADVSQCDEDGRTTLDIAVEKAHKEIIKVLINFRSKNEAEERATMAEQKLLECKQQNDALQLQITQQEVRVKREEERAARIEQQLLKSMQQNNMLQQQIRVDIQQAEERAKRAEERAITAEERATTAEERAETAEERATTAQQQLLETNQQNNAIQQQIIRQAEQADERARRAEERATRVEQEFRLFRQQSETHLRFQVTQVFPQNSDHMKSSWTVKRDEIEVMEGKPLGVGGWGEVRVAMFRGVRVAAKFLHEEIISPHNTDLFIREMNIAACVRHPNLLLFIGATLDDNKPIILTELMPANLRNCIDILARDHVITIGTDVASGLNYLHLMSPDPIIHRDISSANVLLERTEFGCYRAKVSDYGSANFLSKLTTIGPGNASYAAPESSNPKLQSPKMDVYSYGILLLEMVTRQFPDYKLQTLRLDTLLWQGMKELIRKCTCEDPTNRPTMRDILVLLQQLNI